MAAKENEVMIHLYVPENVRDTLNALKESDGKYTRKYIFMLGYEAVMGLTEEDPEALKRELEQTTNEQAVLREKKRQIIEKLEAAKLRKEVENENEKSEEAETEKKVSEIMRLSSEIVYFKNIQMLRYLKGLLSDKPSEEIDKFFDRKEIPTETEIRAFLRG